MKTKGEKKHSSKNKEISPEDFIDSVQDNSTELFLNKDSNAHLQGLLATFFDKMNQNTKKSNKIVFENYGIDQVWNQLQHHTSSVTTKSLTKLTKIIQDSTLDAELDEILAKKVDEAVEE